MSELLNIVLDLSPGEGRFFSTETKHNRKKMAPSPKLFVIAGSLYSRARGQVLEKYNLKENWNIQ
jgi:hypothetical protein